jgi:Mce-associated membrane protein
MNSPERPAAALDADHHDNAPEADALALAEAAEAEAAAAEAEARAAAARTRALRLRRQAEAARDRSDGGDDGPAPADSDGDDGIVDASPAPAAQPRTLHRPSRKTMAVAVAFAVIGASLAASGYMGWQDHNASKQRQRAAEYATAAGQDIEALMSLDLKKTEEDMQRIAANSTGNFKNSFPAIADKLIKGLEQSKVTTTVTVNDVAVESMTADSAIVLVAATTEAKGPDGPPQSRSWHLAVGLRRDGGKPKMANIEFVQ